MGGNNTKSVTTTENDTTVVNKTTMNVLNKNLYSVANENILKVINETATIANLNNVIKISGYFKGDLNFKFDQSNYAVIKLTSEVISTMVNKVDTEIVSTLMNDLINNINSNVLSDLVSNAESNIKNGWANINFGTSNETVNSSINNINANNTYETNLQNIVEACVSNTLVTDKVNSCISNIVQGNEFILGPVTDVKSGITEGVVVEGNATIDLKQQNMVNTLTNCIISDSSISQITENLASITGVKIKDDTTSSVTTETKASTSVTAENQGLGAAIGDVVSSIGTALSDVFSGTSGLYSLIISVVFCIVLIIAIVGVGYVATNEQGSQTISNIASSVQRNPSKLLRGKTTQSNTRLPTKHKVPKYAPPSAPIKTPDLSHSSKKEDKETPPPSPEEAERSLSETQVGGLYNLCRLLFKF